MVAAECHHIRWRVCGELLLVGASDKTPDPGKLPECTRMVFILHKDNVSYWGKNCIKSLPMATISLTQLQEVLPPPSPPELVESGIEVLQTSA